MVYRLRDIAAIHGFHARYRNTALHVKLLSNESYTTVAPGYIADRM
jgi:hypothetical protein